MDLHFFFLFAFFNSSVSMAIIKAWRIRGDSGGMSEQPEESAVNRGIDQMSSSSSDSDDEKSFISSKINRLFGRQKALHKLMGGGSPADILLWRNKKASGIVLVGATAIWLLFECLEYHLLTLICYALMLYIVAVFVWSGGATFLQRSPPPIPEIKFSEDAFLHAASALRVHANRFFAALHDVASVKDLKAFLLTIAALWILSVAGGLCNFLTLFYIGFVAALTLPVVYEKYEDQVDAIADMVFAEIKKQYGNFDALVLSKIPKIPRGPEKQKKSK